MMKNNLIFKLLSLLVIASFSFSCSKTEETAPKPYNFSTTLAPAMADGMYAAGILAGANQVPAIISTGTGTIVVMYSKTTKLLSYDVKWKVSGDNTTNKVTAMHFHGPSTKTISAPVILGVTGFTSANEGAHTGTLTLSAAQEIDFLEGKWYFNIHSNSFPSGELRVQMEPQALTGNGSIIGAYDPTTKGLTYTIVWKLMGTDLNNKATAMHFHDKTTTNIVLGLTGFTPANVGTFNGSAVLSEAQAADFIAGKWYLNIHSNIFPNGEIRGDIAPKQ